MIKIEDTFATIIDYIERLVFQNNLNKDITNEEILEQRTNIDDLKKTIMEFEMNLEKLNDIEPIQSDITADKLILIHKYVTDLERKGNINLIQSAG